MPKILKRGINSKVGRQVGLAMLLYALVTYDLRDTRNMSMNVILQSSTKTGHKKQMGEENKMLIPLPCNNGPHK